jgi:OmcA/MtrC family decaheme c-type cytochrome
MVLVGSIALLSETTPPFTERDKAFYLDEATAQFIRPGLVFTVTGTTIESDGTVKVRYKITDPKGAPLDRTGVNTPGTIANTFIIAALSKTTGAYEDYIFRTQTSTWPATAGKSATQASGQNNGTYKTIAEGEYEYTFSVKLPSDWDKTATHAVGIYGSRNLSEFDMPTNYASTVYHFNPDGSAVKEKRQVIKNESCNKCHEDVNAHGGSRRGLDMCVLCHAPAYKNVKNTDPESDNTIDMTVMTHKIHMGAELPSVQAGKPYFIVGNGNVVHDYSHIHMPFSISKCTVCHEKGAMQENAYSTNPSRDKCGSCHDNIKWDTGEGHFNLPQTNDARCSVCHIPVGELEFDASVVGAHTQPKESMMLRKVVASIASVEGGKAGTPPTVNFQLKYADNGAVVPLASVARVALVMAGPTTDYVAGGRTGYTSEDPKANGATLSGDTYKYTFRASVPAEAKGTYTVGLEGRMSQKIYEGTAKEQTVQFNISNVTKDWSVDGSALVARRKIVDLANCNKCHDNLVLHGDNRNKIEQCILCHNPVETDTARRPAAQAPAESVNMNLMIHRIHAGSAQTRDYTVYGFGNTPHNYNEVNYPMSLSNCASCHTGTTFAVPAKATAKINDPRGLLNPTYSASGACLSCHTSTDAASHALANTTTLGESCGACHSEGRDYAVSKAHAK